MTEKTQQIAEYSKTEAELSKLREKCSTTVYDIKTPQGMKTAVSLRAEIRTNRTGIEKVRKEVKAPILALGKLVDSEAERITNELLALEKPIDEKIKAEEKIKDDLKKAEDERKTKVATFFELAKQVIIDCVGKSSAVIRVHLDSFANITIDEVVFLTQFQSAINVNNETIDMLGEMLLDAESKEIAAERAEKVRQAILAKMEVFNIAVEDNTLEAIAKKKAEVEAIVVDSLFGELEQKAAEEKQDALDYLGKFELEVTERLEREAEKLKAEQEPPVPEGYESWQDYANNPKGDSKPICEPELVNDNVIEPALAMIEVTPVERIAVENHVEKPFYPCSDGKAFPENKIEEANEHQKRLDFEKWLSTVMPTPHDNSFSTDLSPVAFYVWLNCNWEDLQELMQ